MILFKEIILWPINQKLHIWVGKDVEKVASAFSMKYKNISMDGKWTDTSAICGNELHRFSYKGEFLLVLIIDDLSPNVVIHELIHVVDRVSERYGLQTDAGATEWRAYFTEMVFSQIVSKKGYKKIK